MTIRILTMSEEGKFPEEWCAELGITMRTLYAWAKERPEFEEAVEAAWHVLHAYWARLLRENIANPALRQSAVLQVLAKRFPGTWGQDPRNTLEHFLGAGDTSAEPNNRKEDCPRCRQINQMSTDQLRRRLAVLKGREAAVHEA